MKYSCTEHLAVRNSLLPASRSGAGAVNGTGVYVGDFAGGECLVILHQGTITGSGTNAVIVEESDDDSTYTAITGAAFSSKTASTDDTVYVGRIKLEKRKKYLRITATDAVAAVVSGALFVLSGAKVLPVDQTNTVGFSV